MIEISVLSLTKLRTQEKSLILFFSTLPVRQEQALAKEQAQNQRLNFQSQGIEFGPHIFNVFKMLNN